MASASVRMMKALQTLRTTSTTSSGRCGTTPTPSHSTSAGTTLASRGITLSCASDSRTTWLACNARRSPRSSTRLVSQLATQAISSRAPIMVAL